MYFRFLMIAVACAAVVSITSHSYAEEMAKQIVEPLYTGQQDENVLRPDNYTEGFNVKKERIAEGMIEHTHM